VSLTDRVGDVDRLSPETRVWSRPGGAVGVAAAVEAVDANGLVRREHAVCVERAAEAAPTIVAAADLILVSQQGASSSCRDAADLAVGAREEELGPRANSKRSVL